MFKNKKLNFIILTILIFLVAFVSLFGIKKNDSEYYIKPLGKSINQGLDLKGGVYVVYEAETNATGEELTRIITQTIEVFRKRVDSLGLTEPVIVRDGEKRIRVELPGAKDVNSAIEAIGKTAQLVFYDKDGNKVLTGANVKKAEVETNRQNNEIGVGLQFDDEGAKAFAEATRKAAPNHDPIVIMLDNDVISAPGVNDVIPDGRAQITGHFTIESASELASLIRAGALPVNFKEVQSEVKSATLGEQALSKSIKGAFLGIILVILMMCIVYRLPGIVASIALVGYIEIFMILFVALKATLTLPGIAALILSVGMAVDANVIIFERIKEELRAGKSLTVSVNSGFSKALSTILDSQITTFIAGVVLYNFGTGPIKGFAVTLILGIIISMFTAIVITKFLLKSISGFKFANNPKLYCVTLAKKEGVK